MNLIDQPFSRPFYVLFVSEGNAVRGVMAEALLNHMGGGLFEAHSLGLHPKQSVSPQVLEFLSGEGLELAPSSPKSLPNGVLYDFVISVCSTPPEDLPLSLKGIPQLMHWPVQRSPRSNDLEPENAYIKRVFHCLRMRINLLVSLPYVTLSTLAVNQ